MLLNYISRVLFMILSDNKRYWVIFINLLGICMSSLDRYLYELFLFKTGFFLLPGFKFFPHTLTNSLSDVQFADFWRINANTYLSILQYRNWRNLQYRNWRNLLILCMKPQLPWYQNYNIQQKKENCRRIFLMNVHAKFLSKIFAKWIKDHIIKITRHGQMIFTPKIQTCLNTCKSINISHSINRLKDKRHMTISFNTEKNLASLFDKSPAETGNIRLYNKGIMGSSLLTSR